MKVKKLRLVILLFCLGLLLSCAPTTSKQSPPSTSKYEQAVSFINAPEKLARKLINSTQKKDAGRVGVLGFQGPNEKVSKFGEYFADKLSGGLYKSGEFQAFVERRQLRQIQIAHSKEFGIRYDRETVQEFGQTLGTDSLIVGKVRDLGQLLDVTAKVVSSAKNKIIGQAGIIVKKDSQVEKLADKVMQGSLTVSVSPAVDGTVLAGSQKARMQDGTASFDHVPYGDCFIRIQASGFKSVQRHVSVRKDSVNFHMELKSRKHRVSFQVTPPEANLYVQGEEVNLDEQGYGQKKGLRSESYSYSVSADGYDSKTGTFNPAQRQIVSLELSGEDAYYSTKNDFFQQVRKMQENRDFGIKVWTNKQQYSLGDKIRFHFRAEKDCYLNLVNVNSRGEMTLLFPNRYHKDNYVQAGRTYTIPDEAYNFSLEVQPPRGTDRIYALASSSPLNIFDTDFSGQSFVSLDRSRSDSSVVRGIGVKLKQSDLQSAAQCVIQVR